MRRMILAPLALFPLLANAQSGVQAGVPMESTPSSSSAVLRAEVKQATSGAEVAMAAGAPAVGKPAAMSASIATINSTAHAMVRETVLAQFSQSFAEAALRQGGSLEYSMRATEPVQASAPKVTRAVEVDLSPEELSEQPAVSNVVVHAIVDANGIARNVMVTQSAGAVVDHKAIAAVEQYRFAPAMVDNRPTWAAVSIAIKIQK